MRTKTAKTAQITIGWRDSNCPMDTAVSAQRVLRSAAMTKARKHLAIECGAKFARRCATELARSLSRLAARVGSDGYLQVHSTNQTTAPKPWDQFDGLGVEVRYVVGNQIVWDIQLWGSSRGRRYMWAVVPRGIPQYVMRERLEEVKGERKTGTYVTQILQSVAS